MDPRFFVDSPLEKGRTVDLPQEEAHHLSRVLRLDAGAQVSLIDGKGKVAKAVLSEVTKRGARAEVLAVDTFANDAKIHLAFALPKAPALEFILRRVTEVGVAEFQPLETQHSLRHSSWNEERWLRILSEVGKQCQEPWFPRLREPLSLAEWLAKRDGGRALLFCHEDIRNAAPAKPSGACDVLVGAEGGWSAEESKVIFAAGAVSLGLGRNRLRAETAALVGVTLAKIRAGELT